MNFIRLQKPVYSVNKNLVDELFGNFFRNDYHEDYLQNCGYQPATNVFEVENEFRVDLLLPGFHKEDVQLNVQKNILTVKALNQDSSEKNQDQFKYSRKEFGTFNFEKQFKLPNTVDVEKISAKYENGILHIVIPKKEEALEKSPVEINIL